MEEQTKVCLEVAASLQSQDTEEDVADTDPEEERTAERRRAPRRRSKHESVSLSVPFDVRVLDISLSGVLLESPDRAERGARGQLRLSLDGTPLNLEIEVKRVSPESGPAAVYRIGARFVHLDMAQQQLIERFVMR